MEGGLCVVSAFHVLSMYNVRPCVQLSIFFLLLLFIYTGVFLSLVLIFALCLIVPHFKWIFFPFSVSVHIDI